MSRLESHKPKKSLAKKIIIILLSIFGISVVAAGSYVATAYFAAENSMKETYESIGNSATKDREEVLEATQPFSILLMGIDTGGVGRTDQWEGRSDSMMVVTINPTEKKTTIVSLDRDLLVNMVGPEGNAENGIQDKLNHAYAYGQTEMSILTIQKLLDIPIDKYAIINMDGLSSLIDAVGGIDVVNNYGEFTVEDGDFVATVPASEEVNGELQKIHLDGKTGLAYARMRYQDPEGDVGRQKRQREVVTKILEKMLSLDSVSNYQKILTAIKTNLKTNIESNATNIKNLLGYKDSFDTIDSKQLQGTSTQIDGIYYQLADATQLLEIQNVLKSQLGEATAEVLNSDIITADTYGYSSSSDTTTSSDYTYSTDPNAGTYYDSGTGAAADGTVNY